MAKHITMESVVVDQNDTLGKVLTHLQHFTLDMMKVSVMLHEMGRVEVATAVSGFVDSLNTNKRLIMYAERDALQRLANDLDLQEPVEF